MSGDSDHREEKEEISHAPTLVAVGRESEQQLPTDDGSVAERYDLQGSLGEGGMGTVRLCTDLRVGRDIAMKYVRAEYAKDAGVRARFLREARVQGQLEHPSIVPVYDLGIDDSGTPFFTMKRIRGATVEHIINDLKHGKNEDKYTLHRLLTAFASVCLTVHYAHSRGVVHRDLKPANLMLGDFGEIYVLDWGLAKIGEAGEDRPSLSGLAKAPRGTTIGSVLGTLGYMAPEQIDPTRGLVDARSDVYALGACFFELLTWSPLHRGDAPRALMDSTLAGASEAPSARAPAREVPPELDEICLRALASKPAARFQSARELHDAIERYLEGDRDEARRRELAAARAIVARDAAARARTEQGEGSADARRLALREVTRALALDPDNKDARETFVRLLTEPPTNPPKEVVVELERVDRERYVHAARGVALLYASWFLYLPIQLWAGIADLRLYAFTSILCLSTIVFVLASIRTEGRVPAVRHLSYTFGIAAISSMSTALGPFLIVPFLALGHTIILILQVPYRRLNLIGCVGAYLVPFALELTGVIPPSYSFEGGRMTILPRMLHLESTPILVGLCMVFTVFMVMFGAFLTRVRDRLADAERRQTMLAWHLRHAVPDDATPLPTMS